MSSRITLIGKNATAVGAGNCTGSGVLQQPLGALVVRGQRQVGQPRRDGLRLVARRHLVEVAVRQRRGVEEVRAARNRGSRRPPCAGAGSARAAGGCRRAAPARRRSRSCPCACEFGTVLSVRTYGALNGSGNALNVKPKLSSMVSAAIELARREERPRVFDVEVAGRVVVVVLGAGLHAERHSAARSRRASRVPRRPSSFEL